LKCLTNSLLQKSNQWLGSMVWDPQRQQALRLEGIIIVVIVVIIIIIIIAVVVVVVVD
jgi:membrane protein DedA with SNARE-associated domain